MIAVVASALWLSLVGSSVASAVESAARGVGAAPAGDCRVSQDEPARSTAPTFEFTTDAAQALEKQAREHFLTGDVKGALDIWNFIGWPRVQCINVEGLVRTRRSTVISYLDIAAGEMFTAETHARIERRLAELPVASRTRLRYDPLPGGSATITPIVAERDMIPEEAQAWEAVGFRSAFLHEVRVDVSGPAGRGEVWSPSYRWSGNNPRVTLRLDAPAPGRLPGIVRFHTLLESQTYRYPVLGDDVFRQERKRVGGALSDWTTSWLRWEGGAAFDRIGPRPYLALEGSLNARAFADRFALVLTAGRWTGSGGSASFATSELVATARSTTRQDVPVLTTLVGVANAGDAAPLALWPGASSGEGRNALLRAHPLRRDSIITGEAFGRQLLFTTTEFEYPVFTWMGTVGIAGFIDAARASRGLDPATPSRFDVDVGTGVRFNVSRTNKVRLDVGHGIRDAHVRLSADFVTPWGQR